MGARRLESRRPRPVLPGRTAMNGSKLCGEMMNTLGVSPRNREKPPHGRTRGSQVEADQL